MKRKTLVKLVIDIVMTATFVALLFAFQTGLAFHEMVGIGACFLMLVHLILNRAWLSKVAGRLNKARTKTRVQFVLDNLLVVGVAGMLVSGLLISVVVIPDLNLSFRSILVVLHKWTAYASGAVIAVHVALHVPYLRRVFGQLREGFSARKVWRAALVTTVSCMLLGVLFMRVAPLVNAYANSRVKEEVLQTSTFAHDDLVDAGSGSSTEIVADSSTVASDAGSSMASAQEAMTEEEYLGGLVCDGCGKACSLANPRCSIGVKQAAAALEEFRAV